MQEIKRIDYLKDINFLFKGRYETYFNNEKLILVEFKEYKGIITLQYLPNGGIQSLINNLLIIKVNNGYLEVSKLIYKNELLTSKEFIKTIGINNLINKVLN